MPEMLDFLSQFCTFYVYSHGTRDYVLKILEFLDPEQKYFFERDVRVLAPRTMEEQNKFRAARKRLADLTHHGRPLFDETELKYTVIIDD